MADDVFGIVGTVVAGAFRVDSVVAEGGFAVVYRGHHSGFSAPVALKCLKIPQDLGARDQDSFLRRFRSEAQLLFALSASLPQVVRPLHGDAFTTRDGRFVPFLALEWLDGETLDAIAGRRKAAGKRPVSARKLAQLLTPVARALDRAHDFHGPNGRVCIVHRDLKPENIFVARVAGEEIVKVLDFGIAKARRVAQEMVSRATDEEGRAPFTPAYAAPEQWVPKRLGQTGPWTDVWGMALTMVELLAARPIIDGEASEMMGTALDPSRRPTPRTEGVEVGDAVEAVFARALAIDPRHRYQRMHEFWDELLIALQADSLLDERVAVDSSSSGEFASVRDLAPPAPLEVAASPARPAPVRSPTPKPLAAVKIELDLSEPVVPARSHRSGEHRVALPTDEQEFVPPSLVDHAASVRPPVLVPIHSGLVASPTNVEPPRSISQPPPRADFLAEPAAFMAQAAAGNPFMQDVGALPVELPGATPAELEMDLRAPRAVPTGTAVPQPLAAPVVPPAPRVPREAFSSFAGELELPDEDAAALPIDLADPALEARVSSRPPPRPDGPPSPQAAAFAPVILGGAAPKLVGAGAGVQSPQHRQQHSQQHSPHPEEPARSRREGARSVRPAPTPAPPTWLTPVAARVPAATVAIVGGVAIALAALLTIADALYSDPFTGRSLLGATQVSWVAGVVLLLGIALLAAAAALARERSR